VVGTSLVLAMALDTISGMVVATFVIIVGGDMMAEQWGSGLGSRGCGTEMTHLQWIVG
jgi:hypothetical protein